MRTAFIGSKSLGVEVLHLLREHTELVMAITLDDRRDVRSRFDDLIAGGAVVGDVADIPDVDMVVVACWYRLIRSTGRMPFLGIHHSLLPKYRGGSPLVWALMDGAPVGTSLFLLGPGIDDGPIVAQVEVPAGEGYIGPILEACDAAALYLLREVVSGSYRLHEQGTDATWCASRHPSDGYIDWRLSAGEIVRAIRAQSHPYPGAWTYSDGEPVRIWRASAAEVQYRGAPGQVVEWNGPAVITGSGLVCIEEASGKLAGRLNRAPSWDPIS